MSSAAIHSAISDSRKTRTNPSVVLGPGEVFILDRQLGLAQLTETVTVTGEVPKPPPSAPLPPLRKQPKIIPVPKPLLASVCGPDKPGLEDVTVGHIVGHRDEARRELFGRFCDTSTLMCTAHFPSPSTGRFVRWRDSFDFVAA